MFTLIAFLKKVKDFRQHRGQRHPLWFILLIVIFGLMTGHLGYRALGDFAKSHQQYLTKYFRISRRQVPSYSTIRRAMMGVDWVDLIQVFNQWASQLTVGNDEVDWLAIDGKSLRSTIAHYRDNQQNFVSIISLFSQTNGLVLNLAQFENKHRSEIHQVQDMVRSLPLQHQVFTLDALHCQKSTVKLIISSGNDYLIAVKKNQLSLYNCLEAQSKITTPASQHIIKDNSHGRNIIRKTSVFKIPQSLQSLWVNSQTFIQVERTGLRGLNPYQETVYYLSSCWSTAQIFAAKIQGHWRIENQLHWVKDVIFQEDNSPLHQFGPVTNFSILQTIAINLFR